MSAGPPLWWRERSARERTLLLLMAALAVLVLGWLLVVRPLSDALDTAKTRHAAAAVALGEARARAAQGGGPRGATAASLPVDALIARTSSEAGFTGARIASQGPARASVAIDAARPQALCAWLVRLEQSGVVVESLRARTNSDRTLAAEARFRAWGP
jgi:general secretion pathway protein M